MPNTPTQLKPTRLYVLVTEAVCRLPWLEAAEAALAGGAGILQLREKSLDDGALVARGEALRALCDRYEAQLIINDRPDIAAQVSADGVHVGQSDAGIAEARVLGPAGGIVGLSTHTVEQARDGMSRGPDYLAVGPMFASPTKPQDHIAGPETLDAVRELTALPLVAIGGITAARAARLRAADMLCVCGAVMASAAPHRAARELIAALEV